MKLSLNKYIAFIILLINGICLNILSKEINCGLRLDENSTYITEKDKVLYVNVWIMPLVTDMQNGKECLVPVIAKQSQKVIPLMPTFEPEINGIVISKCKETDGLIILRTSQNDLLHCYILSRNNQQILSNAYKKFIQSKQIDDFESGVKSKL